MRPKDKEKMTTKASKNKTLGTVSTITTQTGRIGEQCAETKGGPENHTAGISTAGIEPNGPPVDMIELLRKLEKIDKKLKCDE